MLRLTASTMLGLLKPPVVDEEADADYDCSHAGGDESDDCDDDLVHGYGGLGGGLGCECWGEEAGHGRC